MSDSCTLVQFPQRSGSDSRARARASTGALHREHGVEALEFLESLAGDEHIRVSDALDLIHAGKWEQERLLPMSPTGLGLILKHWGRPSAQFQTNSWDTLIVHCRGIGAHVHVSSSTLIISSAWRGSDLDPSTRRDSTVSRPSDVPAKILDFRPSASTGSTTSGKLGLIRYLPGPLFTPPRHRSNLGIAAWTIEEMFDLALTKPGALSIFLLSNSAFAALLVFLRLS
jgi:hypothetical protein